MDTRHAGTGPGKDDAPAELILQDGYLLSASRYLTSDDAKAHIAHYERPAMVSLLPDAAGLSVLDAYCSMGLYSELLAKGEARVLAIDPVPAMLEVTANRCAGLSVETRHADLGEPLSWLADATMDLVVSSLSLDYVEDLAPVFSEFRRICRPGGSLVFSMTHPMTNWHHMRTNRADTYFDTNLLEMHWCGFNQGISFLDQYRRPLQDILNPLTKAGFQLRQIVEPQPLPEMRGAAPRHHAELSRAPCFLCVKAVVPT